MWQETTRLSPDVYVAFEFGSLTFWLHVPVVFCFSHEALVRTRVLCRLLLYISKILKRRNEYNIDRSYLLLHKIRRGGWSHCSGRCKLYFLFTAFMTTFLRFMQFMNTSHTNLMGYTRRVFLSHSQSYGLLLAWFDLFKLWLTREHTLELTHGKRKASNSKPQKGPVMAL